jgi:MoaA/NifB/PqqE/SkfB family radical SAM enzyme
MLKAETNFARHALYSRLGIRSTKHPLLAYVYLTYRCNLHCSYCDDGTGVAYPDRPAVHELSTEDLLKVLGIIRRETDGVIFTGGEPLVRGDLEAVLRGARRMGYREVAVLTNGYALHRHLGILDHLKVLMVSLDTLNPEIGDPIYRKGVGVTSQVLENIELVRRLQRKKGFQLYLAVCVTSETLPGVGRVIDYAVERGLGFTVMPALRGLHPPPELVESPEYARVFDRTVRLKEHGFPVLGTLGYLRAMRDSASFECLPTLLVRVKPNGSLLYPCNKRNLEGGNLLELGDYNAAVEESRRRHGDPWGCPQSCHEGCYMDFSMCVQSPSLILEESYLRLKIRAKRSLGLPWVG